MHRIDLLASARKARELAQTEPSPHSQRLLAQAQTFERLADAEARAPARKSAGKSSR